MNKLLKVLVLAEHDGAQLNTSVYQSVSAAQTWGAPVDLLIIGKATNAVAKQASSLAGLQRVLRVDAAHLEHLLAEDAANIIVRIANEYQAILAANSSFSRNILPRVAAMLDVAMITDVLQINGSNTYTRSIYAGNVISTVQSLDVTQILTVHASNFAITKQGADAEIVELEAPAISSKSRWLSQQQSQSHRPALSSAKVVVSGGRSLGSAEKFEQLLSPLANRLGAALGATRAAVDAGYAPNDIQVGQTGVVVAPDLYIAIGVSGAIQHTYGMKDSKIVVAINHDPNASIFQVADYGLVADLFEAVPELIASITPAH
ncbi:MAG: FAD-binding protein [Methylotenera sp.]|uniref:electron transfer flavoprotein subunit alpha/FixB family protein n=1 Tax=Methylotenera sp. TaxID=2051956 RepID=UPI0024881297|nr:FAD-binding protein [Methylotenera sp.]MDI1310471.1 FAD-binding protein [Methylotenera sp.]